MEDDIGRLKAEALASGLEGDRSFFQQWGTTHIGAGFAASLHSSYF